MAGAALAGLPGAAVAAAPTSLTGSGHGSWTVKMSNPDTGKQHIVRGRGHFSIGDATIRGSITSPGFIANGDCGVSLTLKTADGSVGVVGHTKPSSGSYPTCVGASYRFRFHTANATGALAGRSYQGVGHFDLENSSSSSSGGTFTLTLKPLPTS